MRTRSIHKAALTDAVTPLEEAGKKLAYEAAVEGIVLLENDGCRSEERRVGKSVG